MMIFIWANIFHLDKYIWMNLKIDIHVNVIEQVNTSLRISMEILRSQLSYLKVIDLDQYRLYGGWYAQVNDRFQECKTT